MSRTHISQYLISLRLITSSVIKTNFDLNFWFMLSGSIANQYCGILTSEFQYKHQTRMVVRERFVCLCAIYLRKRISNTVWSVRLLASNKCMQKQQSNMHAI